MACKADCQQDRSADVRGGSGTRDIWRRHIEQLKPTEVEVTNTDTVKDSQPKVASTPPAPIQLNTPPNVTSTVPGIPEADQPEMAPVSIPIAPEASPDSSTVRDALRERAGHHRNSISELFFVFHRDCRLLDRTVKSIRFVFAYFRFSYKLGTGYFCAEEMFWSSCAFTIYSSHMRTLFRIKRVCCDRPCCLGVFSDILSVHDSWL